ncbi:YdeI/OmpD-associated family protein [Microvirga sp. 3-52]|nr:YdeI/OmpD-associated family protein [Microvirga sp. 3-52]
MAEKLRTSMGFRDARELGDWLAEHHHSSSELWVQIFKAGSGRPSVTWTDCVVEAIRFGWIDGQKQPHDAASFLQRLTPRKPKSNWSARNREHATRLIADGRMTPAGLAHVDAAKADGRWHDAYAGSAAMVIPQDFLDALETIPDAKAFFETLDRKNLYPIYYRLQTAKRPETRAKRMAQILAQLERGERFH